ncbi:MAG: response regulator [Thermoleophilia bacterium]|nr:response regulator [Thermoleophilia bacterium]
MSKAKILIVEDNLMNLELVSDVLEAHGYEVLQADTGRKALEIAGREQPELVLMDIQLPEMDGLEVTRLLKEDERTSHISVIALTAHAMRGDEERAREAGCSGYIAKPINTREFAGVIADFLAESRGDPGGKVEE